MKISSSVLAIGLLAAAAKASPVGNENLTKKAVGELVRGVNLGGWLLLEPWITPSVFDQTNDDRIVDEFTFGQYLDPDTANRFIQNHLDGFISKQDFIDIKAAGLSHVRIPFPYWATDQSAGEPYIVGERYQKLKDAINWANETGVKVWVDLHGVPGSQNGFDNSGHKGDAKWHTNDKNYYIALGCISTLADEFSKPEYGGAVEVIELMNEPAGFLSPDIQGRIREYYLEGYDRVASRFGTGLHDDFEPLQNWNGFMTHNEGYENVWMDIHKYQIFSPEELARSDDDRIKVACSYGPEMAEHSMNSHYTVTGEFTSARTDCTRYLNGRDEGYRWEGSFPGSYYMGSCEDFRADNGAGYSEEYRTFLRKFFEAQIDAYERGSGWFFWTWKAEEAADWSYQRLLELDIFPSSPDDRMYPNICG